MTGLLRKNKMDTNKSMVTRRLFFGAWLGLIVILVMNALAHSVLHRPAAVMLSDGWWDYWFPAYGLFLVILMATSVRRLIWAADWNTKYLAWFSLGMIGYGVTVPITIVFTRSHAGNPLSPLVALLPVAAAGFMIAAYLVALSRMDEFQRLIHVRALAASFSLVGFGTFAYAWLERAGLPRMDIIWILPASIILWGGALSVQRMMYR